MSYTTLQRLKYILDQGNYGYYEGDANADIQIIIKEPSEIIEEMDTLSIIEILISMKRILKNIYPDLSYCQYGSGLCDTDRDRNEEERDVNHAWPSCTSSVHPGAAYELIDKAIEKLKVDIKLESDNTDG